MALACFIVPACAATALAAVMGGTGARPLARACAVVVRAEPVGPPSPAGGWHVVFADGFAAPLGGGASFTRALRCAHASGRGRVRDRMWHVASGFQSPEQANDLNVYLGSQVRVGARGLELVAHHKRNAGGSGRNYISGEVKTTGRFALRSYAGATFAIECVCRWPRNGGAADPAFWHDGNQHDTEQEVDDFEAFGWQSDHSAEYGAGIPILVGLGGHTVYHTEGVKKVFGFNPTRGFHRYTTVIGPGAPGQTRAEEYIEGRDMWSIEVPTPSVSVRQHLILSYALRQYPGLVLHKDTTFAVRSVAVYEDGAHAGKFVTGGGVAPGTVLE